MEGVKMWLGFQVASFFDIPIQKLISPTYKCLNSGNDCIEKKLKYVCVICIHIIKFVFLLDCLVNSSPEVTF
jgi:hypothetical protein